MAISGTDGSIVSCTRRLVAANWRKAILVVRREYKLKYGAALLGGRNPKPAIVPLND